MADEIRFSELPAATVPLTGTEIVAIVQEGTSKQVLASEIGGGGGVEWGAITGDLYNQTDLQAQLDSKQEYLFSGTNIKTINSSTILGAGNINVVIGLTGNGPITTAILTGGIGSISINQSTTSSNGYLSSTDWNTFNGKQASLVSGTNIKTINGTSILGSGDIVAGAPSMLESNATDLTLWNNGKGNVLTNTSFGDGALRGCLGGDSNTAIGYQSLYSLTYGQFNVAVGRNALKMATSGGYNTAIGNDTLDAVTTATSNVAVGYNSLSALTTGSQNTAVGHGSGSLITTGTQNTAIGQGALDACISGAYNVALGVDALGGIITSSDNVGIGNGSLRSSTAGFQNTAVGNYAMYRLTNGSGNVALGYLAGENNTTGSENSFFGYDAGASNTTGTRNIFIGTYSGASNTTGGSNTAIGNDTNTGNFSGCVIIGRGATATASNQFVVGSSGINAGTVTTESLSSTNTWSVKINGTDYKILLA